MLLFAHLAAGWIVGKLTGNVPLALLISVLVDADHLISYIRNGLFSSWKRFSNAALSREDPYGDQRHAIHTVLAWALISLVCALLLPSLALTISTAYFAHLLLDALDDADMMPLLPWRINVRGPIPYNSTIEYLFTALLLLIAVFI